MERLLIDFSQVYEQNGTKAAQTRSVYSTYHTDNQVREAPKVSFETLLTDSILTAAQQRTSDPGQPR